MRVLCATEVFATLPISVEPTATQKRTVGQEVPNRPDHDPTVGLGRIDQDVPLRTSTNVFMVFPYSLGDLVPTATQNRGTGQEIP